MFWKRLFVGLPVVLIVMCMPPAWALMKIDSNKFEVDGEVLGESVSEIEILSVPFNLLTVGNNNMDLFNSVNLIRSEEAITNMNHNGAILHVNMNDSMQSSQTNTFSLKISLPARNP